MIVHLNNILNNTIWSNRTLNMISTQQENHLFYDIACAIACDLWHSKTVLSGGDIFLPIVMLANVLIFFNHKGVFKYYISALEGGGGLTKNADALGGSQVKIDDVILEHIHWKIPTNNLIYIQLNSYSDYSSRWLWSKNLEIKWIIGFSEVSFLSLMIFCSRNNPRKQWK